MSRYEADLERLATQLARMAADPTIAAATDVAAVNRARLGVRRWCRAVLDDVAPAQKATVAAEPGLAELARHPVGVLQALLDHDPHPLVARSTRKRDAAEPAETEAANQRWRQLLAAAEVASHEWASSDPSSRPTGEQAWATVADVAAVTEAAALLDRDLPGRPSGKPEAGRVRDCWEIPVAAEQVRHLAASGPLLTAEPLRPAPHRLKPVAARSPQTLAPALANLAALVTAAGHIGPDTVGALAATHARTLRTLADSLAATGPPAQRAVRKQLANALANHAAMLLNVQVAARPLRSLDADDPRPTAQMLQIRGGLRQLRALRTARTTFRGDQTSLIAALGAALQFAPAVASSVYAHIASGRWLQPRTSARLGWEKVSPDAPIAEAAMLAQGHAYTLAEQLPQARTTSPRHRSPHDILTPPLARQDRQRGRGTTPADGLTFGDLVGGGP